MYMFINGGAKCGSGTPVNSVDACCKTHDECYIRNKSFRADGIISAAFRLKIIDKC